MPFCTHEGSGLGRSAADISRICPNSIVAKGIAIRGSAVRNAKSDIEEWLKT